MTAKERSEELFDKFYDLDETEVKCSQFCYGGRIENKKLAIKCATIAVNEILNALSDTSVGAGPEVYWQEVKTEIDKL